MTSRLLLDIEGTLKGREDVKKLICCWHRGRVFISEVFRFEILGFEQVDEDFYKVHFRDVEIGEFDAEALRFRPVQVMR
jgi:hypothetical protein